jgi:hypothetical protein
LLSEEALSEENFFINQSRIAVQYVRLGHRASEFECGDCSIQFQVPVLPGRQNSGGTSTCKHRVSKVDGCPRFSKASALPTACTGCSKPHNRT